MLRLPLGEFHHFRGEAAIRLQRQGLLPVGKGLARVRMRLHHDPIRPGDHTLAAVSMAFLLGGGLGAIFPKFFFIFNSSLIGAVFVTYGISTAIVGKLAGEVKPETQVLVHLCVFLPALLFGVMYQLTTSQNQAIAEDSAPRPVRAQA